MNMHTYVSDPQIFQTIKNYSRQTPGFVIVENSESPAGAKKDISEFLRGGDLLQSNESNPGSLKIVSVNDERQTFLLEGNVIFTKPGQLRIDGTPLNLLHWNNLEIGEIPIESSSTGFTTESNRILILLTFVTVGLACLTLFLSLKEQPATS